MQFTPALVSGMLHPGLILLTNSSCHLLGRCLLFEQLSMENLTCISTTFQTMSARASGDSGDSAHRDNDCNHRTAAAAVRAGQEAATGEAARKPRASNKEADRKPGGHAAGERNAYGMPTPRYNSSTPVNLVSPEFDDDDLEDLPLGTPLSILPAAPPPPSCPTLVVRFGFMATWVHSFWQQSFSSPS